MLLRCFYLLCLGLLLHGCSKKSDSTPPPPPPPAPSLTLTTHNVNGVSGGLTYYGINTTPVIKITFSAPVNKTTVNNSIILQNSSGTVIPSVITYENNDNTVIIQPSSPLSYLAKYFVVINTGLKSQAGGSFQNQANIELLTVFDPADKFPVIADNALLDLVQQQTFKYFWDFGHPVSGLARERNTSPETITSGGSGFGIMAIVTGISRNFITRAEGLTRMQKIVGFLKNTAQKFHGAFPHWLNGTTGAVIPFSTKDNGADLVETSYLMQGLLTARQFFQWGRCC